MPAFRCLAWLVAAVTERAVDVCPGPLKGILPRGMTRHLVGARYAKSQNDLWLRAKGIKKEIEAKHAGERGRVLYLDTAMLVQIRTTPVVGKRRDG